LNVAKKKKKKKKNIANYYVVVMKVFRTHGSVSSCSIFV